MTLDKFQPEIMLFEDFMKEFVYPEHPALNRTHIMRWLNNKIWISRKPGTSQTKSKC